MRSAYRINNTAEVAKWGRLVSQNPAATRDQQATAHFFLGKQAFDDRNYDEALSSFNFVVKNSDNVQSAEARFLIAQTYYLKNEPDIAETLCNQSITASSNYPFWVAKSLILMSDILDRKGDILNAKAALEAIIENFTEDPALVKLAQDKLNTLREKEIRQSRVQQDSSANSNNH
jgi:tetratricopeptide (TPR) repeat protein